MGSFLFNCTVSAFALVGLTFQAADQIRPKFHVPFQFVLGIVRASFKHSAIAFQYKLARIT